MRRDQLLIFEGDRLLSGWMGGGGKWIGVSEPCGGREKTRRNETKKEKRNLVREFPDRTAPF